MAVAVESKSRCTWGKTNYLVQRGFGAKGEQSDCRSQRGPIISTSKSILGQKIIPPCDGEKGAMAPGWQLPGCWGVVPWNGGSSAVRLPGPVGLVEADV